MQVKLLVALMFPDNILQNTEVKGKFSYNTSFLLCKMTGYLGIYSLLTNFNAEFLWNWYWN